jgi:outer membrane protein OmpA-like peptidoglycan-associated protein
MPSMTRPLQTLLPACCLLAALLSGCAGLQPGSGTAGRTSLADDAVVEDAFTRLGFYPARVAAQAIRLDLPSDDSFASGSAEVPPAMQRTLDDIARQFNSPLLHDWQLLVVGHADDRGSASDNEVMSLARAVNVQRYLVGRGVDAARLRSEGRGEREPLATNDRRYGRELNRRVELFLHRGPLPATATAPR